jgi:hypothetical protein
MQIPADKKSSLQLSIEAELAVISAVYSTSENSNDDEISDALGAEDFVSNVATKEATQDEEPDQELLQEFNDSLGGNSEGILANALEEEADQNEEEGVSEESGFGALEKPSVDDITVESLEEDAFDAAAHEELKIEDDIEESPGVTSSPDGGWPKSHLQAEIESEMGSDFSSPEVHEEAPVQVAEPAPVQVAEPVPVQAAEPVPVQAAEPAPAPTSNDKGSFARKPLWEGSDAINASDFDDTELENIMDEIEDLEKKYRENNDWEDGDDLSIDSNKKKMTDLQKSIEDDINAAKIESHLSVEEPKPVKPLQMSEPSGGSLAIKKPEQISPLAMDSGDSLSISKPDPITPLAMDSSPPPKKPQSRPPATSGGASLGRSEMSFSATGQMNFNMDFMVGEKVANINVNGDEGLSCMMDDYKVVIKEGLGFILEMPGGAKLTIPVDNSGLSQKKKVG